MKLLILTQKNRRALFILAIALLAGAAVSAIHAFLTISLGANQIVSGLGLVFFGSGLSQIAL